MERRERRVTGKVIDALVSRLAGLPQPFTAPTPDRSAAYPDLAPGCEILRSAFRAKV